jgi:hypothetical protein
MKAASKDKGKGHALLGPYNDEVPAGIPSFEDDPYGYSLAYDNDEYDNEYIADYAAVPTSDMAARVAAILAGTTQTGNSASSSREGREPAVLHPKNIAKFQLTMEATDAAHRKGNDRKMDLLASLQKVVSLAHKAGKNQSPLEKSITKTWRVPDWLPTTRYDQAEGKHVPLNITIGQQCEYCKRRNRRNRHNRQQSIRGGAPKPLARQGGNTEYKALLLDVAEKLGHVIDGEPDP